ncbi:MAG: TetR family transcriptional regulator [Solirubrobacteraceae bacterium]
MNAETGQSGAMNAETGQAAADQAGGSSAPPAPAVPLGLRERKKQRTGRQIADTARRLFAERGFEHVTVAEIARVAEVSEGTVFNYFPSKEDLVYERMEVFEQELLKAVRERGDGESLVAAFRRFILTPRGFIASTDPSAAQQLRAITQVIAQSPALLAREQQILDRYTHALASVIAEERGQPADDVEPQVMANALLGVHRALLGYVRREIVAGTPSARIARGLRQRGERALALLEHGLE